MTKEVLVAIKGLQFDGESKEDYTTILPAEYYMRNGKHYVVYDELMEGYSQNTKNIIKFNDDFVEVTKKGVVNVQMLFEKDRKNLSKYGTPFGEIMLGINATHIRLFEAEDAIHVDVEYDLEMNYQHLAVCKITIDVRPQRSGEELFDK